MSVKVKTVFGFLALQLCIQRGEVANSGQIHKFNLLSAHPNLKGFQNLAWLGAVHYNVAQNYNVFKMSLNVHLTQCRTPQCCKIFLQCLPNIFLNVHLTGCRTLQCCKIFLRCLQNIFFKCSLDWVPYTTMLQNIFTMFAKYFFNVYFTRCCTLQCCKIFLQCLQTIF